MTRVEKNASVAQQIEKVEGSVVREVRSASRRHRPALTCSLIVLTVVVGFLVWAGWLVAATGLVEIPLLTSLAYDAPAPLRVVTPGTPVEIFVENALTRELTARLQSGSGELEDRRVTLTVSEASFTATLRSLLEGSGLSVFDPAFAQMAIDPESGAELFVPIKNNPRASAIRVDVAVTAQDGTVSITPTRLRVGSLDVPAVFLRALVNPLLQQQLAKLNDALIGYARIDSVTLAQGEMTLTGALSVELQ
ncbi:hypothetical protein HY631_00665 [Candidatus Uhrbacteria bacterium]|nr:hypothetical protein [Candidatus Uhrbacteria bacterium]